MVERRIKPYEEAEAGQVRRQEQARTFRRNQAFGLVALAALVAAWWLCHTHPGWIFPTGWWRP